MLICLELYNRVLISEEEASAPSPVVPKRYGYFSSHQSPFSCLLSIII
jgi:hypothetical protein